MSQRQKYRARGLLCFFCFLSRLCNNSVFCLVIPLFSTYSLAQLYLILFSLFSLSVSSEKERERARLYIILSFFLTGRTTRKLREPLSRRSNMAFLGVEDHFRGVTVDSSTFATAQIEHFSAELVKVIIFPPVWTLRLRLTCSCNGE